MSAYRGGADELVVCCELRLVAEAVLVAISKRRACSCDADLPTIRLNALCRRTEVGSANTGHTETDMQNCGRGTGEDIVGQVLHDPAAIMEGGGALVTVLLEPHHVVVVHIAVDALVDNASINEKVGLQCRDLEGEEALRDKSGG